MMYQNLIESIKLDVFGLTKFVNNSKDVLNALPDKLVSPVKNVKVTLARRKSTWSKVRNQLGYIYLYIKCLLHENKGEES